MSPPARALGLVLVSSVVEHRGRTLQTFPALLELTRVRSTVVIALFDLFVLLITVRKTVARVLCARSCGLCRRSGVALAVDAPRVQFVHGNAHSVENRTGHYCPRGVGATVAGCQHAVRAPGGVAGGII